MLDVYFLSGSTMECKIYEVLSVEQEMYAVRHLLFDYY